MRVQYFSDGSANVGMKVNTNYTSSDSTSETMKTRTCWPLKRVMRFWGPGPSQEAC